MADDFFADIPDVAEKQDFFADIPDTKGPETSARGLGTRVYEGMKGGFGDEPLGLSPENQQKFPMLAPFQPLIAGADVIYRAPGAVVGAAAGYGAGMLEHNPNALVPVPGLNRAEADRLQRDLGIVGQGVMIEPGMGSAAARAPHARDAQRFLDPTTPEEMAAFRQRAQETAPPPPAQEQPLRPGERGPAWREEIDDFIRAREERGDFRPPPEEEPVPRAGARDAEPPPAAEPPIPAAKPSIAAKEVPAEEPVRPQAAGAAEKPGFFDDIPPVEEPPPAEPPPRRYENVDEAIRTEEAPRRAPEAAPEPAAAPRKGGKAPSLSEYIAANGGLELTPEARDMGLHKQIAGPRFTRVAGKNGKSIDGFWRERLMEAGYLEPDPDGGFSRDIRAELYQKLQDEQRGQKHYSVYDRENVPEGRADERSPEIEAHAKTIADAFEREGIPRSDIETEALYEAADSLYRGETKDPLEAYDRAATRLAEREDAQWPGVRGAGEAVRPAGGQGTGPGGQEAPSAAGKGASGAVSPEQPAGAQKGQTVETGPASSGTAAPNVDSSKRRQAMSRVPPEIVRFQVPGLHGPSTLAGRVERTLPDGRLEVRSQQGGIYKLHPSEILPPKGPAVEPGVEGKPQYVIPGAEQRQGEMLQRKADASLKGKVPQKPMDSGLFGDESKQADIFDKLPPKKGPAQGTLLAERQSTERGRSGRPTKTKPIPIGTEEAILEKGYEKATGPQPPAEKQPPYHQAMLRDAGEEIIADQLELKNHPRWASLSRGLQIGKANPTERRVRVQDKFLRIKHLEEQWKKDNPGVPFPEHWSTYQIESLYYGKTGYRLEQFDEHHFDPLLKDMRKRRVSKEELDEFLMARHAPERNREVRKINKSIANPAGMSDAEAAAILQKYQGRAKDFYQLEFRVRKIIDATLDSMVQDGLITPETVKIWKEKYANYVPLRGHEGEVEGPGHGKAYDIRGPESRRAMGRRSRAESPLTYVISQAQQAIIRGERNRVGQAAGEFFSNNPEPMWVIDKAPLKRVISKTTGLPEEQPDLFDKPAGELVEEVADRGWRTRENVFAYKVDGQPHYIRFEGPYGADLVRALKSIGTANMGEVMRFVSTVTRTMARLNTTWNPEFMLGNFTRDAGEAFINLSAEKRKGIARSFGRGIIPAIYGALQVGMGRTGGKWAQLYRDFDKGGGKINFFGMETPEDISRGIDKRMRLLNASAPTRAAHLIGKKVFSALEIVNSAVENGTRLSAYAAGLKHGMTHQQALSFGRELTVNFNRKGELGSIISGLYQFANAGIQGPTRMLMAMKHKSPRRWAYGLAAMAGLFAFYNIAAGGKDKDGKSKYSKIPEWERDTNLILMHPDGSGKYSKMPLPYGYSMFKVIGDRTIMALYDGEDWGHATMAMISSTLDAFDPLGRDKGLGHFVPSAAKPAWHVYTNQNAFGRSINPEPMPYNKHKPDSQRAFRSASPAAKEIAEALNSLTGGTHEKPGAIDVGPGTVDYSVGAVTGGLGRFIMNIADSGTRLYQGRELEDNKIPFARRFQGKVDEYQSDRAAYFSEREKVFAADQQKQAGPDRSAAATFKSVDRERTSINKQADAVKADTKLTEAQRDTKIKQLRQKEMDAMFRARTVLERERAKAEKRPRTFAVGGSVAGGASGGIGALVKPPPPKRISLSYDPVMNLPGAKAPTAPPPMDVTAGLAQSSSQQGYNRGGPVQRK